MAQKKIKEQDDIIQTDNQNLVVSASAGSGKTSVMIRKIVRLVLGKNVDVKELLVLTYTNSAAVEMKQKLINEMQEKAEQDKRLLSQIDDVPLADISTFDSFCQKIVKRYFYVLAIDPGFNIVQGTEQTELQNKALKNTINFFKKQKPDDYYILFNAYASNRTDKKIYSLILDLYNFCCSILDYEQFKNTSLSLFEGDVPKATQNLFDDLKNELIGIKDRYNQILKLSNNLGIKNYCEYCNKVLSTIDGALLQQSFEEFIDYISTANFAAQPRQNNLDDGHIKSKMAQAKEWQASFVKRIKEYGGSEVYKLSVDFCKKITNVIFDMHEIFCEEYKSLKKKQNLFDFNDIERLAIKLFENNEILSEIKSNYKYIFVDEFQDANLVQERIINLLKGEDNLFLVGDLKQAIYRFRQSDPKIFERITNDYEKQFAIDQKSNSMYLNCNFRTTKGVLDFVNKIFSCVMTLGTANLNYGLKSNLVFEGDFQKENYPCVELNVLYSKEEGKIQPDKPYSVVEHLEDVNIEDSKSEAYHIAERITKLLDEDIFDSKKGVYRKINYSDICVLFRTRASQQEFVNVFGQYNIPVVENSNEDLEETYDIQVLINLIKVSQNIKNDYALASVMMSNLFCFDADEMLKIRNFSPEEKYFYNCLLLYSQNDELKQKIDNMMQVIKEFKTKCDFEGIDNAICYVINLTDYEYKLNFSNNSYSRKKNIKDYINSFSDSSFNFNASSYLNFMENNTRQKNVTSGIDSYNAVTLTTMHASKGLEWPVVICVGLGKNFNREGIGGSSIVLNSEEGLGVKYYDDKSRNKYDSVFYDYITNKNNKEDFAERLRLLYVALTRPKNRLILIGTVEKKEFGFCGYESDRQITKENNYLSLIVNSLGDDAINKINAGQEQFFIDDNNMFVCRVINKNNVDFASVQNSVALFNNDENKSENLAQYISKRYEFENVLPLAQKNSVSKIMASDDTYASYNYSPKQLTTKEHLSDIDKNIVGSVYHKIFELVDFESEDVYLQINKAIKEIKNKKLFEQNAIDLIDKNLVAKNIHALKQLTNGERVLKEHSFVMQIPYNEVEKNSNITDNILVQGVCDLVIVRDKEIVLVDYKFSSLSKELLINKYSKQLELYKKALEYGIGKSVNDCYILDIKSANLVSIKK